MLKKNMHRIPLSELEHSWQSKSTSRAKKQHHASRGHDIDKTVPRRIQFCRGKAAVLICWRLSYDMIIAIEAGSLFCLDANTECQ